MIDSILLKFNKKYLMQSKKKKEIIDHISRIFTTKGIHCAYQYRWRKEPYREAFWWGVIHSNIYVKNWRCYMPRCLGNIQKLLPEFYSEEEERKLKYDDVCGIHENNILFLIKRSKQSRDYIKPEELSDCARFITASLSGTDIKYVFYGKKVKSIRIKKNNKHDEYEEWIGDAKIYPKEFKAFEDAGLKIVKENCDVHAFYNDDVKFFPKWEYMNYSFKKDIFYQGTLFEIPKVSKNEAGEIFRKLRNERFEQLHFDFSN